MDVMDHTEFGIMIFRNLPGLQYYDCVCVPQVFVQFIPLQVYSEDSPDEYNGLDFVSP